MVHDIKFYIIVAILVPPSIASVLTFRPVLIIFSLLIASLLIAFYRLYDIIEAAIFRHSNIIQIIDGCEISGDRSTAVRKVKGGFFVTAAAMLESNSNDKIEKDKIENIVTNSHCPFRFVLQVERVDIRKLLDRLQTRRIMNEFEMDKLSNNSIKNKTAKINALKRRIEQQDHEIERITAGNMPLKVTQYIMTSSFSESKPMAKEHAKSQIRELASEFGALVGTKSIILDGNDLLNLLKFDSASL